MKQLITYSSRAVYQLLNPLGKYTNPSANKILLGSREHIERYIAWRKMKNNSFEGKRSDGQVYWIAPRTTFFEVDPSTIPLHKEQLEHYEFLTPDLDWLYESLLNKQFLMYSREYWELFYETTKYKQEQEVKVQAYKQKIRDKLTELGEALTTETFKLVEEIHNYDHFYSYIDDGKQWRNYDDYSKQLAIRLKRFPILEKYFSDCAALAHRRSQEYIAEQQAAKLASKQA